jgi:hypothetical protein
MHQILLLFNSRPYLSAVGQYLLRSSQQRPAVSGSRDTSPDRRSLFKAQHLSLRQIKRVERPYEYVEGYRYSEQSRPYHYTYSFSFSSHR